MLGVSGFDDRKQSFYGLFLSLANFAVDHQ
jgi:hypothetical protein